MDDILKFVVTLEYTAKTKCFARTAFPETTCVYKKKKHAQTYANT